MLENNKVTLPLGAIFGVGRKIDGRASQHVDAAPDAHLSQGVCGLGGRREVVVGQHGVGVAHLVVDAAGMLPALNVGQGNVLIGRRERGCQRLVPVGYGDNEVWSVFCEDGREIHRQDTRLSRSRVEKVPSETTKYTMSNRKWNIPLSVAIVMQYRSPGEDDPKIASSMQMFQNGVDAGERGPRRDDDCYAWHTAIHQMS